MNDFKDSWKNEKVFKKQLELNITELHVNMPEHWKIFLLFLEKLKKTQSVKTILDVGCGCGAFAQLLNTHHPDIKYTGMDYAEEAIKLASEQWKYAHFIKKNYTDLTKNNVSNFDIINSCGLHQILPNGDEAIEHFLSLEAKILIFLKLDRTDRKSYFRVYEAYDIINTYEYYHNYKNLCKMFLDYGYNYEEIRQTPQTSHFLLRKK